MRFTDYRVVAMIGKTGLRQVEAVLSSGVRRALALVTRPPVVVVLVVDEDNGRIAFVRQGRVGAKGAVVTEAPAGVVERGEDAETAAAREVEEETGLRPTRMELVAKDLLVTPGYCDEVMTLFVASELVPGTKRPADAHVELVWESLDELDKLIDVASEGGDLKTYTLLLALSRNLRNGR
jgi:ADP-ribose pyrophosphatase